MDAVTLYDDLCAVRRTLQVSHKEISNSAEAGLRGVLERVESQLKDELQALPEEELQDLLYELDIESGGRAWSELSKLVQ